MANSQLQTIYKRTEKTFSLMVEGVFTKESMVSLKGLIFTLLHPQRVKWLFTREVRFRNRLSNKESWIEWQTFDSRKHIGFMESNPVELAAHPLHIQRLKIILNMVSSIGNHLEILDVGCGNGAICGNLRETGNSVTCIELPGVVKLTHNCGVPCVVAGDAESLAFGSGSFDLLVASEMVEHLWSPDQFFAEAYRVLNDNGYLLISTPDGETGLSFDSHKHYFTVEKLERMLKGKFVVCSVEHLVSNGNMSPTLIVLLRKVPVEGAE